MSAVRSAKLLLTGSAWLVTGATSAGRSLVSAVCVGAEDERAVAGMLLVRAGDRSVALIEEALATPAGSPTLVDVLASIATAKARAALVRAAQAPRPEIAAAAAAALQTLDDLGPTS